MSNKKSGITSASGHYDDRYLSYGVTAVNHKEKEMKTTPKNTILSNIDPTRATRRLSERALGLIDGDLSATIYQFSDDPSQDKYHICLNSSKGVTLSLGTHPSLEGAIQMLSESGRTSCTIREPAALETSKFSSGFMADEGMTTATGEDGATILRLRNCVAVSTQKKAYELEYFLEGVRLGWMAAQADEHKGGPSYITVDARAGSKRITAGKLTASTYGGFMTMRYSDLFVSRVLIANLYCRYHRAVSVGACFAVIAAGGGYLRLNTSAY